MSLTPWARLPCPRGRMRGQWPGSSLPNRASCRGVRGGLSAWMMRAWPSSRPRNRRLPRRFRGSVRFAAGGARPYLSTMTAEALDRPAKPNGGFAALWRFLPMLWPKGEAELKARVVVAVVLVLAGKAAVLLMAFAYKAVID